ncbi:hypothetical protein K437DRAFT_234275 [Tilletiaria anomala UBC 951]|uniref:Jacalin-type lectin domain-containing protein n=1 Tax=Tilletiaria anomala (strain ATCC 24038 / CBS 436.72 / UBC 951) TaxID=1037660 RepID=A0A066W3B9_TILAU|nr:uncharacterized protein K437DRAFT_234275 [Tilletiaria anomala UBC 951]KDN48442.1 hypothetical protein K437DRAFT_234275 [Tilletiaria anomala UBC 951]
MPPAQGSARIRISNVENRETVFQRLLIVQGYVEGYQNVRDTILVQPGPAYEPVVWQVNHGHFKALVPLSPGPNELAFEVFGGDFEYPDHLLQRQPFVQGRLSIWFQRDRGALPLQLAILVACDSPALNKPGVTSASQQPPPTKNRASKLVGEFSQQLANSLVPRSIDEDRPLVDAPPGEGREKLKNLDEVKRRFALQAYLWQAFHAEQMRRMCLGPRTFALDDANSDVQPESGGYRKDLSEYPKVHILVSRHTTKEIRDPDNAQQNQRAKNRSIQHRFAGEVLEEPERCPPELRNNKSAPIAVMTLEATWDPCLRLLRGHAALGSFSPDSWSFGVMGSHWLWSAPSSLHEVTSAFQNCSRTDTAYCINDLLECVYHYETLNVGSGAMMHEVGHAFSNPHWPSGLMARGYVEFNRAFMTSEGPHCKRPGNMNPITPETDSGTNHLHRAQGVRARWHPAFALPSDPPLPFMNRDGDASTWKHWKEAEPTWEPTMHGANFRSKSGIASLEVFLGDTYKTHIEFTGLPDGNPVQQEMLITNEYLSKCVGFDVSSPASPSVNLTALACNMREIQLQDFRNNAYACPISLPRVPFTVTKGMSVGKEDPSHQCFMHVFRQNLSHVVIRAGAFVDGLVLFYPDGSRELLGCTGGEAFRFDLARGEQIAAIEVRSGLWLDAINIILSSGRQSGWRGGEGGNLRTLQPPRGSNTVGLYGSSSQWIHTLGLLLA